MSASSRPDDYPLFLSRSQDIGVRTARSLCFSLRLRDVIFVVHIKIGIPVVHHLYRKNGIRFSAEFPKPLLRFQGNMQLTKEQELFYKSLENMSGEEQQKAVRLDVLAGNVPAEKLYEGLGFKYMDALKMYYEDTGWTDYELYEYVLH
ncbi:MAG: hypothetical protein PUC44_05065 [Eubacteriales bacterium]|nr:hypothetical protein [Eubacteriales bacterium]